MGADEGAVHSGVPDAVGGVGMLLGMVLWQQRKLLLQEAGLVMGVGRRVQGGRNLRGKRRLRDGLFTHFSECSCSCSDGLCYILSTQLFSSIARITLVQYLLPWPRTCLRCTCVLWSLKGEDTSMSFPGLTL